MADLGSKKISSNYQKLLQKDENGMIADGSGSLITLNVSGSDYSGSEASSDSLVSIIVTGSIIPEGSGSWNLGSADKSGDINFFSADANSIYSPKIEVRWDEHNNDYTGTFEDYEEEFNDGTGTFEYPDVPINPVTIDGTDDNYMFMIGLRKTYKETEKPRFRVAGRERYKSKTVSTTKTTQNNKLIPHGSGSYSIIDVGTGETLIPFGDYSKLSTDTKSNYFKLNLSSFINNRLYRVLLRLRLNDGRYRIFDDNFDFKVIS